MAYPTSVPSSSPSTGWSAGGCRVKSNELSCDREMSKSLKSPPCHLLSQIQVQLDRTKKQVPTGMSFTATALSYLCVIPLLSSFYYCH